MPDANIGDGHDANGARGEYGHYRKSMFWLRKTIPPTSTLDVAHSGARESTCVANTATCCSLNHPQSGGCEKEAESDRPGITLWTDGSQTEQGAVGYAVVWRPRHSRRDWVGIITHMGHNQEVYDAEGAALVKHSRSSRTGGGGTESPVPRYPQMHRLPLNSC